MHKFSLFILTHFILALIFQSPSFAFDNEQIAIGDREEFAILRQQNDELREENDLLRGQISRLTAAEASSHCEQSHEQSDVVIQESNAGLAESIFNSYEKCLLLQRLKEDPILAIEISSFVEMFHLSQRFEKDPNLEQKIPNFTKTLSLLQRLKVEPNLVAEISSFTEALHKLQEFENDLIWKEKISNFYEKCPLLQKFKSDPNLKVQAPSLIETLNLLQKFKEDPNLAGEVSSFIKKLHLLQKVKADPNYTLAVEISYRAYQAYCKGEALDKLKKAHKLKSQSFNHGQTGWGDSNLAITYFKKMERVPTIYIYRV